MGILAGGGGYSPGGYSPGGDCPDTGGYGYCISVFLVREIIGLTIYMPVPMLVMAC